jgi:UDP-glucose:(heptosyl)LPS alpha-1,3-glucosyltransferase
MACGLPVMVSRQAGVSEIATDGVDGLILEDPGDSQQLANLIRRLYEDPALRKKLGESAVRTARQYTWERNAEQMKLIFEQVLRERQAFRRDGRKPS